MSIFNEDYNEKIKPDVTDSAPISGVGRWLFLLSNHFFRLLELNLLFFLLCIPIITIPAALAGLTNALKELYLTGTCLCLTDFFTGFRKYFILRTLFVFLLLLVPLSIFLWLTAFGLSSLGAGIFVVLFPTCCIVLCYFTLYSALLEIPADVALKQAFRAFFRFPTVSLKLLFCPILLYAAAIYFCIPYTAPLLLFILFSAGQLSLCCIAASTASPTQQSSPR